MISVKRGFWLALLSAVCCYTANAQAQVFKCVDADGHVIFTDTDCGSTKQEVDIVQSSGGLSTAPAPATGLSTQEKAALIVSWSSLEKRRAEYEEIVKVKIPENTKEIAIARSYGDLSENFEFKAAKQMQSVLMRRKAELEQMLHDARGTSFENPDRSRVSIGTIVTLRNGETNNEETYTILGAWDGDPDRHIISYQTAIGQALLGHENGETISLNRDEGAVQYTIVSIQPAPPDQTAPAPGLPSESAVEAAVAQ